MSRRLRYIGSNSGNNGCPTLYEDEENGNVVVQGDLLTDPDEISQLRNVKPGEGFVTVPRVLLADFAPLDAHREPVMIGFDEFEALFESFQHTAFRLETRRQYRSDELTDTYRRFVAGKNLGWESDDDWSRNRREQSARGKRFERVRVMDNPPTTGQRYLLANAAEIGKVGEDVRCGRRTFAEQVRG